MVYPIGMHLKNAPVTTSNITLLPVPDSDRLLCNWGNGQQAKGTIAIATDESVTLMIQGDNFDLEERIWFASPNLRMRTNVFKSAAGFNWASFCSEIRMGGGKPAA